MSEIFLTVKFQCDLIAVEQYDPTIVGREQMIDHVYPSLSGCVVTHMMMMLNNKIVVCGMEFPSSIDHIQRHQLHTHVNTSPGP